MAQTREVDTWGGGGGGGGLLPLSADFSGLSSVGVPGEVPRVGQYKGTLYVYSLKGPSGNPAGVAVPLSPVLKL